jgi:SPP1 gp7 family putative phage head morphogenesis protein
VAAVGTTESALTIRRRLDEAARELDVQELADDIARGLLHGTMLGALDSVWEREENEPVPLEAFAGWRADVLHDRSSTSKPFTRLTYDEALRQFQQRQVLTPDAFAALDAGLKRQAFAIAGLAQTELIEEAHDALERMLRDSPSPHGGPNLRDFQAFARDHLESAGWTPANPSHVETVYRTQIASAYSTGRFVEMRQPEVMKARPYWQIFSVRDSRSRPAHAAAHGTILPADDPFWAVAYPPFGFACRCRCVSRSQRWMDANGATVGARPAGLPDPGFDSGTTALPGATEAVEETQAAPPVAQPTAPSPMPVVGPTAPPGPVVGPAPPERPATPRPSPEVQVTPPPRPGDDAARRMAAVIKQAHADDKAGGDLRAGVRDLIGDALGIRSPQQNGNDRFFRVSDRNYNSNGAVTVSADDLGKAEQALRLWSSGSLGVFSPSTRDRMLEGVSTLIHEEIHSWMPGPSWSLYNGYGAIIEEVQTELLARKAIRQGFAADFVGAGAYNNYIRATTKALLDAQGLAATPENIASVLDTMEAAAARLRDSGVRFRSAADYLHGWAAEMQLSQTEAAAFEAAVSSPAFVQEVETSARQSAYLPLDR